MAKTTDKITLKYEGDAVSDGSIDVRKFAPSLIEFSKLLDAINNEVNQGEPLRIEVAATKHGSFEIDLIVGLINSDNIQIAQDLFKNYKSIKEIVLELFKLKKFLKGEPAKEIKDNPSNPEQKQITNAENITYNINANTVIVAQNMNAGEAMENFVNTSVEASGIDQVAIINPDQPEKTITIPREEINYYKKPELKEREEETIAAREQEISFSIYSLAFNEKNKWKLKDSRNVIVSVDIKDEDFLDKVMRGDISFSVKDILECLVTYTEYRDTNGDLKTTDYKVIKVNNYWPYPKQRQLPL